LHAWDLVILTGWYLAVARVTRLINQDVILEDLRAWFVDKVGGESLLAYLVNCAWCVSIWVAVFSLPVPVYMADRTWPQAILFALGASWFTGITAGFGSEEIEIETTEQ
jgi:Protein of unknown function (DUF1360)